MYEDSPPNPTHHLKKKEEGNKKKGRRPKNSPKEVVINKDQTKFFVDLSKNKKSKEMVINLLLKANKKERGQEITFKEIALYAIEKLTSKDIEKIQEGSLTKMEKVEQAMNEYNQRNGTNLCLEDFLIKKLNIN